jgi:hypothetical protein
MIPNIEKPTIRLKPNKDIKKQHVTFKSKEQVFVKDNVLSHETCDSIIEFGNKNVQKGINKYTNIFGISFHTCLLPLNHEVHALLEDTWNEISKNLNIPIDFVETYELKRYTTGDFFGMHTDNYVNHEDGIDRKITMSIQLSDELDFTDGGLMVLNKSRLKSKGSLVAFPSYFPHEVKPISSGTRWALIGWAWGKTLLN